MGKVLDQVEDSQQGFGDHIVQGFEKICLHVADADELLSSLWRNTVRIVSPDKSSLSC